MTPNSDWLALILVKVEVAMVEVAVMYATVGAEVAVRFPLASVERTEFDDTPGKVRLVMLRLSKRALVARKTDVKKLVVVACVPVAFWKVKFWRVEEPLRRSVENVAAPAVKASVPMLIEPKPEVIEPALSAPTVVKLAKVVKVGKEVEAAKRLSKRTSDQYLLVAP